MCLPLKENHWSESVKSIINGVKNITIYVASIDFEQTNSRAEVITRRD